VSPAANVVVVGADDETGPPYAPRNLTVSRVVTQTALLLDWELPQMDELGRSNGVTVVGYKIWVDGKEKQDVTSATMTKALLDDLDLSVNSIEFSIQSLGANGFRSEMVSYTLVNPIQLLEEEAEESAPIFYCIALYDYDPFKSSPNPNPRLELNLTEGGAIKVLDNSRTDGFYYGECNGVRGLIPSNFVEKCDAPTCEEPKENDEEDEAPVDIPEVDLLKLPQMPGFYPDDTTSECCIECPPCDYSTGSKPGLSLPKPEKQPKSSSPSGLPVFPVKPSTKDIPSTINKPQRPSSSKQPQKPMTSTTRPLPKPSTKPGVIPQKGKYPMVNLPTPLPRPTSLPVTPSHVCLPLAPNVVVPRTPHGVPISPLPHPGLVRPVQYIRCERDHLSSETDSYPSEEEYAECTAIITAKIIPSENDELYPLVDPVTCQPIDGYPASAFDQGPNACSS
jgi:hypothetical protein